MTFLVFLYNYSSDPLSGVKSHTLSDIHPQICWRLLRGCHPEYRELISKQ
jgi:hypothetical protein